MQTILFILLALALCAYFIYVHHKQEQAKKALAKATQEAKDKYDAAKKAGNKQEALNAGREYYSLLRGGPLTIYDEQALTNDISVMQ